MSKRELTTGRPRLFVATPGAEHKAAFTAGLLSVASRFEVHAHFQTGSYLPHNRDILTERALESGAPHVLWVDSDMLFNADDVQKLLEAKRGIVSGVCTRKSIPPTVTAKLLEDADGAGLAKALAKPGLYEAEVFGAGFVLMRREYLEALREFWSEELGYTVRGEKRVALWWPPEPRYSEDYAFCHRARMAGKHLWLHTGVVVGHIGDAIFSTRGVHA